MPFSGGEICLLLSTNYLRCASKLLKFNASFFRLCVVHICNLTFINSRIIFSSFLGVGEFGVGKKEVNKKIESLSKTEELARRNIIKKLLLICFESAMT